MIEKGVVSASIITVLVLCTVNVKGDGNLGVLRSIPKRQHAEYDASENLQFFPAIVGGTPALEGEFPSHVSIQDRKGRHICGGTLIDLDYVLTAGHCVSSDSGEAFKPNTLQVMGDDLTIKRVGSPKRQIKNVRHVFIHPQYDPYTAQNDVAVLKVFDFTETKTLKPASLSESSPREGDTCVLAGWGTRLENNPRPNPVLYKAELTVTNQRSCNASYAGAIAESMFCAKGQGQDACHGDSGGALLCGNQDKVNGIVSFGNGCNQPQYPGVYTHVTMFAEFIDNCFRVVIPLEDNEKVQSVNGETGSEPGSAVSLTMSFAIIGLNVLLVVF